MTDRELKRALKSIYQPPMPQNKNVFLDRIESKQLTVRRFVYFQLRYIRPWVWLLSAGIFLIALLALNRNSSDAGQWMSFEAFYRVSPSDVQEWIASGQLHGVWNGRRHSVWMVSALIPFAAFSTIVEISRSSRFKMDELELASRFSLKTVMLARLGALGGGNLILLLLLSPFVKMRWDLPVLEIGFYMLCPYCLTAFCCLCIVRCWHGKANLYVCAIVTCMVSLLCMVIDAMSFSLERYVNLPSCMIATLLLLALMVRECKKFVLNTEVYVWN